MARNGVKTGGRQKGSPNKKTAQQKARAAFVMEIIERDHLEKDIKKLTAGQRMQLYSGLMEYVLPKLARVEQKHEGGISLNQSIVFK